MTYSSFAQCHTMVVTLQKNGTHDAKTLHSLTSIPLSTIYDHIKKLKKNIPLEPLSRPGRPKRLSPKKCHHLGKLVSANKFSTCSELANTLNGKYPNLNISKRTVLNELHRLNYISTVSKTISLLTNLHKQRCIEFVMKYRKQNWNKIIFSDETTL